MDLRVFYRKIREIEQSITEPSVVVTSLETPDGGKAGVLSEVPRAVAARMIAEVSAVRAGEEETQKFHEQKRDAKKAFDEQAAANRVQVVVTPVRRAKE